MRSGADVDAMELFFVPYAASKSSSHDKNARRQAKNRHVQIRAMQNHAAGAINCGHGTTPNRVQIKFQACTQDDGNTQASPDDRRSCNKLGQRRIRSCMDRSPLQMQHGTCNTAVARSVLKGELGERIPMVECQIPCGLDGCPADVKALHYFTRYAADGLASHLPAYSWLELVVQGTKLEPVVRQAVLAVSSAHLQRFTTDSLERAGETRALQYMAIRDLRAYMCQQGHLSPGLVVACCILLSASDKLQGHESTAIVHLKAALSILAGMQQTGAASTGNADGRIGEDDFTSELIAQEIQESVRTLEQGPAIRHIDGRRQICQNDSPSTSSTLPAYLAEWKQVTLDAWILIRKNVIYRQMSPRAVPPPLLDMRQHLLDRLGGLQCAFQIWVDRAEQYSLPHIMFDESLGEDMLNVLNALLVQVHILCAKCLLVECLGQSEACGASKLGPFDESAEDMLVCAERALVVARAYRATHYLPQSSSSKGCNTHVGAAYSLLCLSHRTTSPAVRARAQDLIRSLLEASGRPQQHIFAPMARGLYYFSHGSYAPAGQSNAVMDFCAGRGALPSGLRMFNMEPGH